MSLALGRHTDVHENRAARVHADVGALEGAEAGAFHVGGDADADRAGRPAAPGLLGAPGRIAELVERELEHLRVVGRVVGDGHTVAIAEPRPPRHLLAPHEVLSAEIRRVHANLPRGPIEEAVEDEIGLGTPRAAIRGGKGFVGHDVAPHAAVVGDAVGADQVVDRVVSQHHARPAVHRHCPADGVAGELGRGHRGIRRRRRPDGIEVRGEIHLSDALKRRELEQAFSLGRTAGRVEQLFRIPNPHSAPRRVRRDGREDRG